MKETLLIIFAFIFLNSCSNNSENPKEEAFDVIHSNSSKTADSIREVEIVNGEKSIDYSEAQNPDNEIPPSGKYRFDMAFAEWQGKSMGEKVTVIINGDSIKIIYEGDGQLTLTEKGEVIDEGKIMKHKSGSWIIGTKEADKELDEIGGCIGGPAIIDFKNKKYWTC